MATFPRTAFSRGTTTHTAPSTTPSTTTTTSTQAVLRLRGSAREPQDTQEIEGGGRSRRRIQWAEDVVDNEGMGRKKSKVCCIYHAPRDVDESSDESSSEDSSSDESSGDDDGAARPTRGAAGGHRGHGHSHGKGKGRRARSPNAYEKVPKVKGGGSGSGAGGGGTQEKA